jgi:hypothetical protein
VLVFIALAPKNSSASGCPKAGQQRTNISVTTEVIDLDPSGNLYTISSDGGGSYLNGVDGVTSILTANTYNCVPTGDWQFNKPFTVKGKTVYSSRKMGVSLNTTDAIQPLDPHYTVTANPPFWGTQILRAQAQIECSFVNITTTDGVQYGLSPAHSFNGFPETTDAQVSCNSADSAGCNDWFIEPIGSLQAVGRLTSSGVNDGDFYMRFRFHITRP